MRLKQSKTLKKPVTVVRGVVPKFDGTVSGYRDGCFTFSDMRPTIDELIQMYAAVDDETLANSVWVMGGEMYLYIATLKDGDGKYLLRSNGLFGRPVFVDEVLDGDEVLKPILIGERHAMIEKVNYDRDIEMGSVFINNLGDVYVYKTDSYYHSNHLVGLSDGTSNSYLQDLSLPTANWIEETLNILIEEGKNYFPNSKYSIDLVRDGE
ncbi:phage major capsid protein [Pediococcus pentosaceus]|uniref:Phage major capsid protein n=1 Tax=Pediococcus pentosaceus TaxID=1255 RepID=A0ABD7X8Y5_PEDPE|nr:phage major capsid protein [Pediococcus pentosaceus]WEA58243.1 phage major capsid protein [Pediococcus pentosaceus]